MSTVTSGLAPVPRERAIVAYSSAGHALMHLTLAVMTARLAYCAATAATDAAYDAPTQQQTSLNTVG